MIPIGIYTIPEMASVGLGEEEATRALRRLPGGAGALRRGRARPDLGHHRRSVEADRRSDRAKLLGVHIVGEGATELVHVGQMALLAGMGVDAFVENIFNFPTLAEAYRVAALDLVSRRPR